MVSVVWLLRFGELQCIAIGTILRSGQADHTTAEDSGTERQRYRHQEWLKFLKRIHRETPKKLDLHSICDNYRTHKHPKVQERLERHPRLHIHFVPTGSSWMNMVERYFRDITENHIRWGVFVASMCWNARSWKP